MAENIVIYAGLERVGKLRKRAIEREAKRATKDGSVSDLVWTLFRKHGSAELKQDLEAADRAVLKK
jgi:hypothetical protein